MLDEEDDGSAAAADAGPAQGSGYDLAVIRDQTRETLELLRALIRLLIPKQGSRDGPSLEQLIAALMTQGRETLLTLQALRTDIDTLLERTSPDLDGGVSPRRHGRSDA